MLIDNARNPPLLSLLLLLAFPVTSYKTEELSYTSTTVLGSH
jgi:hypothetical protein